MHPFEEAVEVVRSCAAQGDQESDTMMNAVATIRMYWDQDKVNRINAAVSPIGNEPSEDELLIMFNIIPTLYQVVNRVLINEMSDQGLT